ncbi:hypothetical protein SMICM17S_06744 [Streptomyces microflavus]
MRVVSLVPSLTEAVAATAPGLLTGVTDWCTHPAGLTAARIGGTKNPDVAAITALAPDLVIANEEENRAPDLAAWWRPPSRSTRGPRRCATGGTPGCGSRPA